MGQAVSREPVVIEVTPEEFRRLQEPPMPDDNVMREVLGAERIECIEHAALLGRAAVLSVVRPPESSPSDVKDIWGQF